MSKQWSKEFRLNQHFTAGLAHDVDRFLHSVYTQFEEEEEPRMALFLQEWRKTSFGLIFSGRENYREVYELTEELFELVKEYASPETKRGQNPLGLRFAAIYLLYALYFKQPCRPKVKIRLILKEFEDLQACVEMAKKEAHYDLVFAWTKLFTENAFHYTATKSLVGPESAHSIEERENEMTQVKKIQVDWFTGKQFLRLMKKMSGSYEKYQKVKAIFCEQKSDSGVKNTFFAEANFPETVKEIVEEPLKVNDDDEEKSGNDIGNARKRLKEQYFSSGNVESHRDKLFVEGRAKAEMYNECREVFVEGRAKAEMYNEGGDDQDEDWTPDPKKGRKSTGKKAKSVKRLNNQKRTENTNPYKKGVKRSQANKDRNGLNQAILKQLKTENSNT